MAEFNCPECGYGKTVSDDLIGRSAKCKKCGCSVPITKSNPTIPSSVSSVNVVDIEHETQSVADHPPISPNFFVGMFDLKLEHHVTPVICRITWVICLAVFAFWLVLTLVQPIFEKGGTSQASNIPVSLDDLSLESLLMPAPTSGIDSFKWFVFKIVAAVLSVLWTRVLLESVVVYFNILKSLRSIEQNTKRLQ